MGDRSSQGPPFDETVGRNPARFTDVPSFGPKVDDAGNIIDPPPGPERDREAELLAAWDAYFAGDPRQLEQLGIINHPARQRSVKEHQDRRENQGEVSL